MKTPKEDEYHTRCAKCETVKENFLFTPGELNCGHSRCRKCCKENAEKSVTRLLEAKNPERSWKNKSRNIKDIYKRKDEI